MNPVHYQSFLSLVNKGLLDKEPIGAYVRDIAARARHFVSPIGPNTMESFGTTPEEFGDIVNGFIRRASEHEKVLLLEDLVCIEDEVSAVFIENHPQAQNTVKVTTYSDISGNGHTISHIASGTLMLGYTDRVMSGFFIHYAYGAFIENDTVIPLGRVQLNAAKYDLFTSTNTVIEQLAYMERQRMLQEVRKIA